MTPLHSKLFHLQNYLHSEGLTASLSREFDPAIGSPCWMLETSLGPLSAVYRLATMESTTGSRTGKIQASCTRVQIETPAHQELFVELEEIVRVGVSNANKQK